MSTSVIKLDGTIEPFKVEKLKRSLQKAGAHKEETNAIADRILAEIHDGITTQEIYRHAFKLLRESELPTAARYSMRRALFGLGPTGFPFEDYLTRLIALDGYTTKTGVTLQGKCASHEIDIAAYKKDHCFIAEAKFHARPGIKSDLQVALYSYARFLDLQEVRVCNDDTCGVQELWVITNTKFTSTAEKYAACVGMQLLSWGYPKGDTLYDRIQRHKLYPVTVLQQLSGSQKSELLRRKVIACRDIIAKPSILRHLHISTSKTEAVLSEARQLCEGA